MEARYNGQLGTKACCPLFGAVHCVAALNVPEKHARYGDIARYFDIVFRICFQISMQTVNIHVRICRGAGIKFNTHRLFIVQGFYSKYPLV